MEKIKIGSLVKYKGKYAIVTRMSTTMGQSDGRVLLNDGTYDYEYEIFTFYDNQHHSWYYGRELQLISDPFESYR